MRYKSFNTLCRMCSAYTLKFIGLFILGFMLVSCSNDDDQVLSLSTNSVSVSLLGDKLTFSVTSNVTWGVSIADKWAKVDTNYGNGDATITLTIDENDSNESRNTTLYVSCGSLTEQIAISQGSFTLSSTEMVFNNSGTPQQLTITSEYSWTASISAEAAWCGVDILSGNGDGTITLTPTTYTNRELRNGKIIFTCLEKEFELVVRQEIDNNQAPSTPTLLAPTNNAKNVVLPVILRWSPSTDADGDAVTYYLYMSNDGKTWGEPVGETTNTQISHTIDNIDKPTLFYWKVVAKDLFGSKSESEIYNFTSK